jgi:glycerol-3-phosphate dehydrogenase
MKPGRSASDTSRSHELIDHAHTDDIEGLITILGGKITAYRAVAKDAADLACRKLKNSKPCITDEKPLPGAPAVKYDEIVESASRSGLPIQTVQHLTNLYGSRYSEVMDIAARDTSLKMPLCSRHPDIAAQVWHAVENEVALTVNDFMLRRSMLGLHADLGVDAVKKVAAEMRKALNWSEKEELNQLQSFKSHVELSRSYLKQ